MKGLASVLKLDTVENDSSADRFEELYRLHRLPVYRFILRQGVGPSVAQDLTQEVFLRRWKAERRKLEIDSDQAWLYGVAAKVTIDHWRGQGSPRWVSFETSGLDVDAWASAIEGPDRVYEDKERARRIAAAMANLPLEQRMAIELRLKGLRYREIASGLGVATSTASGWLVRAVETLRRATHA